MGHLPPQSPSPSELFLNVTSPACFPAITPNIPSPLGVEDDVAGQWQFADFIFNEPDAPHADLTAQIQIPANGTVLAVIGFALEGPWADSVLLNAGDSDNPTAFIDGQIAGDLDPWDPTEDTQGENWLNPNTQPPFYASFQYFFVPAPGAFYPSGDTMTLTLSGIATGGGGGQLLARMIWATAADRVVAS